MIEYGELWNTPASFLNTLSEPCLCNLSVSSGLDGWDLSATCKLSLEWSGPSVGYSKISRLSPRQSSPESIILDCSQSDSVRWGLAGHSVAQNVWRPPIYRLDLMAIDFCLPWWGKRDMVGGVSLGDRKSVTALLMDTARVYSLPILDT